MAKAQSAASQGQRRHVLARPDFGGPLAGKSALPFPSRPSDKSWVPSHNSLLGISLFVVITFVSSSLLFVKFPYG
jgi:hypothetical protein